MNQFFWNQFVASTGPGLTDPSDPALVIDGVASPTTAATDSPITFTASASGGNGVYGFTWNYQDGRASSTTQVATHRFYTAGTYEVILTVTSGEMRATKSVWVTITGSAVEEPVDPIDPDPVQPDPGGTPFQADNSININDVYSAEGLKYRQALLHGIAEGTYYNTLGDMREAIPSFLNDVALDIYQFRRPKEFLNGIRAIVGLAKDPAFVDPFYKYGKIIADNIRTNGEWVRRWPGSSAPTWEDDGGNRWGSSSLDSPAWRGHDDPDSNTYNKEKTQYWKLLYMNAGDGQGAWGVWGTHLHELDNLLAHSMVVWCGYMVDIHSNGRAGWEAVADKLYTYCFSHWEPLVLATMASRDSLTGVIKIRKSLYHNVAAHTSIYHAHVLWKKYREGAAREVDKKALQSMMRIELDVFKYHKPPDSYSNVVANAAQMEIAHRGHYNHEYHSKFMGNIPLDGWGSADVTYDREYGSEIINLFIGKAAAANGDTFTERQFRALSNTYGMSVERLQPGPDFNWSTAGQSAAATGRPILKRSDGTKYVDPTGGRIYVNNGAAVTGTRYGGNNITYDRVFMNYNPQTGKYFLDGYEGHMLYGTMGGWYHWADATTGYNNTKLWLLRAKHNYHSGSVRGFTPDAIFNSPTGTRHKNSNWIIPLLVSALLKPNKKLRDITLGNYTYITD